MPAWHRPQIRRVSNVFRPDRPVALNVEGVGDPAGEVVRLQHRHRVPMPAEHRRGRQPTHARTDHDDVGFVRSGTGGDGNRGRAGGAIYASPAPHAAARAFKRGFKGRGAHIVGGFGARGNHSFVYAPRSTTMA